MRKKYIVELEGTYTGQKFSFDDFKTAADFVETAIEHTEYKPAKAEIEVKIYENEKEED